VEGVEFTATNGEIPDPDFRVGTWLNVTTWDDGDQIFFLEGDSEASWTQLLMDSTDELEIKVDSGAEASCTVATAASNLSTGTWYYIELEVDGANDNIYLFINGVQAATSACTIDTFGWEKIMIRNFGSGGGAGVFYLDGFVITSNDDADMYDGPTTDYSIRDAYPD
jgi:hypothetical protein